MANVTFDPQAAGTRDGELPPWEVAKGVAFHEVLGDVAQLLDTPAADLVGPARGLVDPEAERQIGASPIAAGWHAREGPRRPHECRKKGRRKNALAALPSVSLVGG